MRVLLVNRYYGTEQVPTGRMLHDVACVLQRRGHDVHVLTCRDTYVGQSDDYAVEAGNVSVHHLWVGTRRSRLFVWLLFWLQVCIRLPFMRWDRCILLTDPPFMVFAAWLARCVSIGRRERKAYWWTMDLYPEALVADGIIQAGGILWRLLAVLNELGIGALAGVICLGDQQQQRLAQYRRWQTSPRFCLTVPPWDYRPLKRVPRAENRFLAQHGWCDRRIALYAGNLGRGHTYKDILAAAQALSTRGDTSWMFVFVCRGATRPVLEEESRSLGNVAMLDYVPPAQTSHLLWSTVVHLITMADGWQGIVVPSKLYGILHTEAPVLFIGPKDADTARQICHYDAGAVLPNGCGAEAVIHMLEKLCDPKYRKAKALDLYGADHIVDFVTQS